MCLHVSFSLSLARPLACNPYARIAVSTYSLVHFLKLITFFRMVVVNLDSEMNIYINMSGFRRDVGLAAGKWRRAMAEY